MATTTDFLWSAPAGGAVSILGGLWVRLHNNDTTTDYYSSATTDLTTGAFTHSAPPGHYSVYSGNAATVPGTPTLRNANYAVAATAGDDLAAKSYTALASSPYVPSVNPGTIENYFFLPPPNGVDDTANINAVKSAALAAMVAGPWQGANIVSQPGIYRMVPGQVVWGTKGLNLEGSGTYGTTLRPIAGGAGALISIQAGSCVFKNLLFQPLATQQVGTTLAAQLTALSTYTQMTVTTVPTGGWATGAIVRIGGIGGGSSQYVTLTGGPYAQGGSNVVVTFGSTKMFYTYAIGAAVQDERYSTSTVAADAIQITNNANDVTLDKLRFFYLNGRCIRLVQTGGNSAFNLTFNNLYGQHCAYGIEMLGGTSIGSVQTDMYNIGMDTIEAGDAFFFDSCSDVQGSTLWGGGYGNAVHIRNNSAAIFIDNGNFGGLEGYQSPMLLIENPAAGGINAKPRVMGFSGCLFENGTTGATISDCDDVAFDDCHFFQNSIDGVSITGGDLIAFDKCNFWQNNQSQVAAKAEINVTSTTARIQVDRPRFQSTLVANAVVVPATNAMVLTDPIMAGPPALWTTNGPIVQTTAWNNDGTGQAFMVQTTTNPRAGLTVNDQGANGAGIRWQGSGGNGSKYVRVNGNVWQLVDAAYANVLLSVTDAGLTTVAGALVNSKDLRRSRQTPTEAVLVSGVDATAGEIISVTLTAARLVGAPLNPAIGQNLTFSLTQGGAGGFAVTWNAVFKKTWADTGNTTGKISAVSFFYDGTNWIQTGAQSPYV